MNVSKKIIILSLIAISFFGKLYAQATDTDSIEVVPYAKLIMDDRIYELLHKPAKQKNNNTRMRGYRIQIYIGADRQKANAYRDQFLNQHSRVPAYLIYTKPNFRVRVGNFKSRHEAQEFLRRLGNQYPAMIVPEVIFTN